MRLHIFARLQATVALVAVAAMSATGLAIEWVGDTGDFLEDANWAGGSAPSFEEALINNGGTAQLDGDADPSVLRIGLDGGSGGLVQSGGSMMAAGAFIGDNSVGNVTISSGDFVIGNDSIHVGWRPGGEGTMNIDGPEAFVTSGDDFQLGREGTGTLNMSDGYLSAGYTVIGKFGTGIWNQSGGMFDQAFGDIEIGDGGRDDQAGTAGPRTGTMNISGGFVQSAGHLAIGNRRGGGEVNISGGVVAVTGDDNGNLYIGRGADSSPESGQATTLRVIGNQSTIVVNGSLLMNLDEVSTASTLVAQFTGPEHTPILVAGSADVSNGTLKLELGDYSPVADDSWLIVQAGLELESILDDIDTAVDAAGFPPMEHQFPLEQGEVIGPFSTIDTASAPLAPGLEWQVDYTGESIVVSVTACPRGQSVTLTEAAAWTWRTSTCWQRRSEQVRTAPPST